MIYSLLFVAPLLLIVGLVGLGMGSARLTGFFQRHVAAGKLALAALFLVMGAAVLANAVGH